MIKAIIILSMLACLIGPIAIFSLVGYKSLQNLGKRPSNSSRVMTVLIVKLSITGAILMGMLMMLVKVYGA